MVKGLTDNSAISASKTNQIKISKDSVSQNPTVSISPFPEIKNFKNLDVLALNNKPAGISYKMKNFIKNFEAGDRHRDEDGCYVVYYGKADKEADLKNKKKEPLLTVGHGHSRRGTITVGHRELKEGDKITSYQADKLFDQDIKAVEDKLKDNDGCSLKKTLTQNQNDAIISYGFNTGVEKFCISDDKRDIPESIIECLNKGEFGKAQSKFNIITVGGEMRAGLAKRRIVEMVIFGDGKIYKEAEATFKKNKEVLQGFKKLKHIYDINKHLKAYGIKEEDRHNIVFKLVY